MRERYVVDTNVLIAASAGSPTDPKEIDATPDDKDLLLQVWTWLNSFSKGDARMVLDSESKIFDEYSNKLSYNDYGIQVIMHKWSTAAVDVVLVDYDADGHGVLPMALETVVHDRADRKMVAAAICSHTEFGEGCVAFAGDTDWHGWEADLLAHNVILEPLIEDWSRARYMEKQQR